MKGQSINIDFTVGLGIFIISTLGSIAIVTQIGILPDSSSALETEAFQTASEISQQSSVSGRKIPLYIESSRTIDRVPIDRKYVFSESAYPGSAIIAESSEISELQDDVKTVIKTGNRTENLVYYYSNVSDKTYESDIVVNGNTVSNSRISFTTGSPGITSLEISGKEMLNPEADLNIGSYTILNKSIHAAAGNGDLKIYKQSPEIILESPGDTEFKLVNLTDLYWPGDGKTNMAGKSGEVKSGSTNGFTLANSTNGITFLGDLDANISRPSDSEVKALVNSSDRIRIRLHNSDYTEGKKRIKAYESSNITFGFSNEITGSTAKKIRELENLSEEVFEENLNLENFNYNITFVTERLPKLTVTEQEEYDSGIFNGTTADRKDNSGSLGIGYSNGTSSDNLVGYWRLDNIEGAVKDYSGNGNDGSTVNFDGDERGKRGIFGTQGYRFQGGDDRINAGSPGTLDFGSDQDITVSAWINLTKGTNDKNKVIAKDNTFNFQPQYSSASETKMKWEIDTESSGWQECVTDNGFTEFNTTTLYTATWDGSTAKIYKNGSLSKSCSISGNFDPAGDSNDLCIGNGFCGGGEVYGFVDEVKIYSSYLTGSDIQKLYRWGKPFYGDYRSEEFQSSEKNDWRELNVDAEVPSNTSLKAVFRALDGDGDIIDTQEISVNDGDRDYGLDIPSSKGAEIFFKGTSENISESWEINGFEAGTEFGFRRGSEIPLNQDVVVADLSSVMIGRKGNRSSMENRVALWN